MTIRSSIILIFFSFLLFGCGGNDASNIAPVPPVAAPSETPTPMTQPKNGEYPGKGKVTKLNPAGGTVELDHEEVKGVMPAMKMEFNVRDKSMLKDLKVGDAVDFTLEYKDRRETITKIAKAQ